MRKLTDSNKKNYQSNRILMLGGVVEDSSTDIITSIYEINDEDKSKPIEKREPIKLIINSEGGDVYHGLGIIDAIEFSKTPIRIICHGHAMSMALPILCCGSHRSMSKRATIMYHELSYGSDSLKLKSHKNEINECNRIQSLIDDIITSKTNITQQQLDSVREANTDWYITPEEALNLGIINEIIQTL